ncbi:hypothetical protein GH714_009719 [Hevea brasiliensis]|uniref:Uncharacterized protein n=1 Tax=Hevea brasiliensis TaxID=3981 RepID=A0A6A6L254_HEVBR|nr:hypothetical protein GH714_009719 [Hevea brasiliensis]
MVRRLISELKRWIKGRQLFTVDLQWRYAARGKGVITCMAARNDVTVIGTNKGRVIRHDFRIGDSYDIDRSNLFIECLLILWVMLPLFLQKKNDRLSRTKLRKKEEKKIEEMG